MEAGFSKSFKVDGEFLEVGGNWTYHKHVRHVPERRRRGQVREGGVPPLGWWGVLPLKILKF